MIIINPSVELLWVTPEPEKQIEIAGRTCYKSEDKITENSAKKFVDKIYTNGHHPMLEHASASFRVICDRGISHEIVRHRLASYAQESTRYVNYSKEEYNGHIQVIKPPHIDTAMATYLWRLSMLQAEKSYFGLIELGFTPQIARSVLPTCTKTEIVMCMNLREWIHFFRMRMPKSAHPQIRPLAKSMKEILCSHFSILHNIDFEYAT